MTKAREIMTPGIEVARRDETIDSVARRMLEKDVGAMPVCDAQERINGVITDRDIVVKVVAAGKDVTMTSVDSVVEPTEVVTIGADDSVDEAIATMKQHAVRRLPVIDGDRVVGMVSQGDVAISAPEAKTGDLVESISQSP